MTPGCSAGQRVKPSARALAGGSYTAGVRDLVIFLLILTGIFFAIGEWQGWYLGIPNQTPVYVYKKDHYARTPIRTVTRSDMPIAIEGRVRQGTVRVQVLYESPASFQTGAAAIPERTVFDQAFGTGQRVAVDQTFSHGRGIYTITMTYENASGTFRFRYPVASQL